MKKLLLWVLNTAAVVTLFAFSVPASAQLGSLSKDLVFNPVTPCRILNTRAAGVGLLVAGSTRQFYGISSTGNYPGQGGTSPNCNVPFTSDVAAIVLNFTVVGPDTAGYITAFPADATKPNAATVNFTAGSVVGNNATLKISQTTSNGEFKIYSTSNTHVVADIVGYYAMPISIGSLECVTTAETTVAMNVASGGRFFNSASAPACGAGFTAINTICRASNALAAISAVSGSTCYGNHSDNSATLNASQRCCRIPGR